MTAVDTLIDKLPMSKPLEIIIYFVLGIIFVVFLYKNVIKDIMENTAKKKKEAQLAAFNDNQLLEHNFFKLMYRYIKVDLVRIFDLNIKKDAQFCLLGKCKFIVFYNDLKSLVHQVLDDNVIYKGKKVEEIDFNMMLEMQQESIRKYSVMFLENGGNKYILEKFSEYHSKRLSGITEMFVYLSSQDFFNKDLKSTIMGMLTVYTYAFVQTFEDLKEDHRKINGSINAEMEKFILTEDFKQKIRTLTVEAQG
jgi:hypothetical protein